MSQNAVVWFDIFVNDMDRAEAFYRMVLQRECENISDPTDSTVIMRGFVTDKKRAGKSRNQK